MTKALNAPETAFPSAPAGTPAWGAALFVWGTWALMVLAALGFTAAFSRNVPIWDEWESVGPQLADPSRITLPWLLDDHVGHRNPVPKLLLLGLYRLGGVDVRAGMYASVFALAALAAGMIWAARGVRGRADYADAFFPLVLLNWGQYGEHFLWGWQLHFTFPVALEGGLLLLIVRYGVRLPLTAGLAAGACLLVLPLTCFIGLAFVPGLSLWLGYSGFLMWRSAARQGLPSMPAPGPAQAVPPAGPAAGGSRVGGLVLLGLALAALALALVGSRGNGDTAEEAIRSGPGAVLVYTLQVFTLFLPAAASVWPVSGLVLLVLSLATGALLARKAVSEQPADRSRAVGLLLFLGACALLLLAWGAGRAPGWAALNADFFREPYVTRHYSILASLPLCGIYFAWLLYGPRPLRRLVPWSLFVLLLVIVPFLTRNGLAFAREFRNCLDEYEQDVRAGLPPLLLAERHDNVLYPFGQGDLHKCLREFYRAGVGQFRPLRDDPAFEEVSVLPGSAAASRLIRDGGPGSEARGSLAFTLREPRFVYAIRVKYRYGSTATRPVPFRVSWEGGGRTTRVPREAGPGIGFGLVPVIYHPGFDGERNQTIQVEDTIDQFGIQLADEWSAFWFLDVSVLLPESAAQGTARGGPAPAVRWNR